MTYARTAISSNGFVIVDSSRYQVPNTNMITELADDLTAEELRELDLYRLVISGDKKHPLQELKQERLELDEESRTMTQYNKSVDVPLEAMRKALNGLVVEIKRRAMTEGIIFEDVFCDINGKSTTVKIPLGYDVDRTLNEVHAVFSGDEIMIMINDDVYIKLEDEEDFRLKSLFYRATMGNWHCEYSALYIKATRAIKETQSPDQLVRAYEDALQLSKKFLGD